MDKNEFTRELNELLSSMSEEEIERTLNALNGCKSAISKKVSREKGDKARLLATVEQNEAEFHYESRDGRSAGTIKLLGASLLTLQDYNLLKHRIPGTKDPWWLYDGCIIKNEKVNYNFTGTVGKIRPVVLIEEINGDLKPGDIFFINDEKFLLISQCLAIKSICLEDFCTHKTYYYECSVIKLCVDGWYMKLIRENKKTGQGTA